jgi:hypothetical protein
MCQDVATSIPATQKTVDTWISKYSCAYDVVVDTIISDLASAGSIGLPYNVIIDPRTMKITKIIQGDGSAVDSAVSALITKNGG